LCYRHDNLALDLSSATEQLNILPAQPLSGGREQPGGCLLSYVVELLLRWASRKSPSKQPTGGRFGYLGDVGRRHVEERDPSVGRNARGRRVNASLPRSLDQPENDAHGLNHPTRRSESQRATVAAISTGGTLMTPRRMNSEMGSSSPRFLRTRRHRRVASEPA